MEGQIKVTPEELRTASSEFSSADTKVANLTQEMMSLVTSLAANWEGEASQAYINKFRELDDDMTRIHTKIQEHSTDLEEMAKLFEDAERKNQERNASVPSNLID